MLSFQVDLAVNKGIVGVANCTHFTAFENEVGSPAVRNLEVPAENWAKPRNFRDEHRH